tara:strand:- start:158 stop:847 length:690 start_codon:yes stop_codon:yes gene_type:complete
MNIKKLNAVNEENIYIFDFDGTLFRCDLLILYVIYHFFIFGDKIFLIRSLLSINNKLSTKRKKIFLFFSKKYEMKECFNNFTNSYFLKFLIRKKLFNFLKEVYNKDERILIMTANYKHLVKSFLHKHNITEKNTLQIFGTELPKNNDLLHKDILKGKQKAAKLLDILKEENKEFKNITIYNFFDSYDDRFLCEYSNCNVLVSLSFSKRFFFKKNFNAINYNNYLKDKLL